MQGAGKSLRAGTWCAVLLACMMGAAVCPAAEVLAGSPEAPAGQRAPATAPPSGTAAAPAESPTPVEPATDPATKVATPREADLELTPEAIEARIKVIENKTALSEEDKKKILERLTQAQAELQRADTHAAQAAQFAKAPEGAPAEVERIRTQLAEAAPAPEAAIPAEGLAADLEAELKKLETELAAQHKAVEDLEASLKGRPERKAALPDLITTARKRLAEVEKELAAPAAPAASVAAEAQQTLLRARRRAVEAEIKTLEAELNTFSALTSLLTARRELAVRARDHVEKRAALWRDAVASRKAREAQQGERDAAEAERQAAQQHPLIQELAAENTQLATRRTGPDALLTKTETARRELQRIKNRTERLMQDFTEVKADIGVAGLTEKMGRVLRQRQQRLRNREDRTRNIAARKAELADVLLSLSELRRRQDELRNVDARVEALVGSLDQALGRQRIGQITEAARETLLRRKQILDDLIADHEKYSSVLVQLNLKEQELADASVAFADYIDERALWVRSSGWIGVSEVPAADVAPPGAAVPDAAVSWWSAAWRAAGWLFGTEAWAGLARNLWDDVRARPGLWAVVVLLVAAMVATRGRARLAVVDLGGRVVRARTDAYSHTVKTVALTAWLVALAPLAVGFLGWRLSAAGSSAHAEAFGTGLEAAALVLLMIEVARALCLPDGLGHRHFLWNAHSLKVLRKQFFRPLLILLPVVFVVAALEAQPAEGYKNTLGRLVFMAGVLAVGGLVLRVLRPAGELIRGFLARRQGGWLDRLRYVWYTLAAAVPLGLAAGLAAGWHYTAIEMAQRLVVSLWLAIAVVVAYGLVMRALFMARRRLAIRMAEQRREAAQREEPGTDAATGEVPVEEAETNLVALSEQTRRLARVAAGIAMLVGLWLIWVDVLPALRVLNRYDVWSYGDGAVVTLGDLGLALLAAAATVMAAQNLPGLLEVAVLQHLPLAAGVRFAITTVSRYIITIVGVVATFGLIGIGWAKVQWLAAAITVGLGFGLQDIFANFVSGLIILFERPMRVGDVVTVGETTGTVTKIRIRATTVTDWDRKELIVPNKEFVTGRLMNWSLSDNLLRLTLTVGIAYGSDTKLATDLLLECASKNPHVLQDPAPSAFFDEFGGSALNFKLRFFISGVTYFLAAKDEIHRAVDAAFRAHGIEIAFPQQDIHVRMGDPRAAIRIEQASGSDRNREDGE